MREWGVDVEGDEHVGFGWGGDVEIEFGRGLSLWGVVNYCSRIGGISDKNLTGFWDVHAGSDIFAAKLQAKNFGGVLLDQRQVPLDAVVRGHLGRKEAKIV